jgi:aspartyl-tRNA(Asn)/glutamyl-tRNA(Gln) amidotransferase subunit A
VGEEVEAVDPGVASVMGELRARLAAAGVIVDEVQLPLRAARAAVGAIVLPELAAAHARLLAETGEEGYGPPVLAAIRLGQAALAGEYLAGLRYRGRFAALVEQALAKRDALVLPTVPVPAPRHDDSTVLLGGVPVGVQAALTALPGSFNCSGSPVLSLPAGVSGGLPVGISLVGRAGGDGQLLRFAAALEPVLPAPGRPPTSA